MVAAATIPMGMTFANLSGIFKRSGGPVVFVKTAFGDFFGFIAGWSSWFIAAAVISSLALAIPFFISVVLELSPLSRLLISLSVLSGLTALNYFGAKFGAKIQVIFTLSTLFVFGFFIVFGLQKFDFDNFLPIYFNNSILLAAVLIFEAFAGWEACTIIAEEVKQTRKFMPRAIIITTITVAILYSLIAFVSMGAAGASVLASSQAPLVQALSFSKEAMLFMLVATIVINIACLNSWILTTSRLPYALAREKLFLDFFEHINKHGVPDRSLFLQFLVSSLLVVGGTYIVVLSLTISVIIVLYILCFLSAIKLRKTHDSSFKIPTALPVFSIIVLLVFLTQIDLWIIVAGISSIFLAVPVYVILKLWSDRNFIEKFYDRLSLIFDFLFPIWYGKDEREVVLRNAELEKKHVILDYGCGTGITTMELAKRVKKIVAVDISRKQIEKAFKKNRHENIVFVKISSFAPFEPETFDRIIAVGVLDHFVWPEKELKQLNKVLKKRGIISCLCFGNSLGMPTQKFLRKDNIIKNIFKRAGFSDIKILRKRKWLTEYIFIKAKK